VSLFKICICSKAAVMFPLQFAWILDSAHMIVDISGILTQWMWKNACNLRTNNCIFLSSLCIYKILWFCMRNNSIPFNSQEGFCSTKLVTWQCIIHISLGCHLYNSTNIIVQVQVTQICANTSELIGPHEATGIFFFVMYRLHVVKLTVTIIQIYLNIWNCDVLIFKK